MKKTKLLTLTIAATFTSLLLLTGCAGPHQPPITIGTITKKTYTPENNYTTLECGGFSSNGLCSLWYTATHHEDEKWTITIENTPQGETKPHSATYPLPKPEWDTLHIGDIWETPTTRKTS